MARAKLSEIRAQMEKLMEKEQKVQEELAMEFGKYFVKNYPDIETITEFKEWVSKANDSIEWIMKRKEEREQFEKWAQIKDTNKSNNSNVNQQVSHVNQQVNSSINPSYEQNNLGE